MNPSRRFRKAVEIVLAAMLALPAFLIAGAHAAAARNIGLPPTLCVNDVVDQFNGLKHHPEGLGFNLGAGAHDPTSGRHYQGIVRIPGEGPPRFVTAKNGNVGSFEIPPGMDDQPGEINVIELASRDTNGERVRSNRMIPNESTQSTPPPAEDRVIQSIHTGEFPISSHFRHLGGMQMWGQIALIGMDRPYFPNNSPGEIVLLDFGDGPNPHFVGSFSLQHQASSIGIAPFGEDRLLLITTGNNGSPIYGYEIWRNGGPTRDLRFNPMLPNPYLKPLFTYDAAVKNVGWPTGFQSLQTTNLFTDCNTGEMFLMGGYNLSPFENTSRDRLGIWKIDPLTGTLSPVNKRQIWCEFDHMDRVCNMAAASGFYVSPSGDLIMYATEHENDGPGGTVRMAEFSSQDGYDQDGAYRPAAAPGGGYTGQPNVGVAVDGSASTPAVAQARVELYDEPNFGGRGLVIDYPDHGKEDYRHLSRVEDYNDEASSVRWRVPKGCEAVLFDDKDYRGPRVTLPAAQGGAQANANLKDFNDDTTSVQFYGDCDGRIVSWAWDVDDNGSVEATTPAATVTATTPGVHKLALTVCSGFGVCDKKLTTLDVTPAGTLPKTTPTLTGTAGANGWYRSAVTVNLVASGTPAPTEIRYSATGSDPMGEQVVQGTTASLTVDAQGETVVRFRALNTAGEEVAQTVAVKVDTVAPALTVRTPMEGGRYVSGSAVAVAADCTDATSGIATCANGTALDTAGAGARTLNATATDAAGNTTTKPVNYTLVAAPPVDAQLVFVARNDASPGPIQRSNADGSNVIQLTDRGDDPVWSPDGTKVAYVVSDNSGVRQVHVVNADGTGDKAVTANTTWQASSPSWSPDGSRIVYSGTWVEAPNATDRIIHRALLTVPAAGGASTVVATSDTDDLADPVYARNGATITFVGGNQIRSVPVAGVPAGELGTVLVGGNHWYERLSFPAWSPDGSTLTFQLSHAETFTSDIYAWAGAGNPVNLTGTDTAWPPVEIPTAPLEIGPTFLADGRLIFVQDGNVYLMNAQRGAPRALLLDLPYGIRSVDARGA